jgi:phospholipid/cholesterol/gamma-HCH transport system substrate-binding protein
VIGRLRSVLRLVAALAMTATAVAGCEWRGLNSLPLPGTQGQGPDSYTIQAQLPNVVNIQPNSRVRVNDVNVGTVTKIEREDWHALVTLRLNGDVVLPSNATATVGQTSLLGTMHIELAPPTGVASEGHLHEGSTIPLDHADAYPTTEQTLSVASMFLNGGGLAKAQDITEAFNTAFTGREADLRSLIQRIDEFTGHVQEQTDDIIAANESFNNVAGQFARQKPVLDDALRTIPDALAVLRDNRDKLVEAFDQIGKFSALAADSVDKTKVPLVKELRDLGPVLESLADAGPALTRSLSLLATYPWPKETINNYFRGDAANITMIIDMTLSRLDSSFFTGTRWEGNLTELEMQWGRTIGQLPSPVTGRNPLVVPYHLDQGP